MGKDEEMLEKGFLVQPDWCDQDDTEAWFPSWGDNAGKAKFRAESTLGENWFLARARRSRAHDLLVPLPDPALSGLPEGAVGKLVHACGCSPEIGNPGYRNRYVACPEPDLEILVKAGLMKGPFIREGLCAPIWFATDKGMAAALSTRPRIRGEKD